MCYLITIVIPAAATAILKQQSQALLTEDIVLLPTFNPSITQYFRDDMSAFAIIRGTCSCDLYTGRAASPIEKRRQKYKTKGWSEAKIQRALAGKSEPSPALLRATSSVFCTVFSAHQGGFPS